MSAGARVALIVTLLVALLTVAAGHVATASATSPQVDAGEPTNVTTIVDVRANGDARWTVTTTFELTSEAEREGFRRLADAFESGETSTLGLDAFRRASSLAGDATGREMSITDVERRTAPESAIENGTGRLTVAFTWTNFGYVEDNRLVIDDAFETGDGAWLSGLDEGETLVIRAPEGGAVVDANVPPKNGTLRWTGPAHLNASTLEVEFAVQGGPSPTPPGSSVGSLPLVGLFALGLVVAALVVYLARRDGGFDLPPFPAAESERESDRGTGGTGGTEVEPKQPPATEPGPEPIDEPEPIDSELLSDEERVERLLERNGGRMKQASIVKETGWSNAKVSQLLSSMEEEGRIDKLRIGRENLISFPDEDVTDIKE